MDSHARCACQQEVVTANSPDIQSGADWFDEQDASTQLDILGPGKFDAWQNGDFTLEDIVGYSSDPVWGNSIYEKSLKQLVGR